MISRKNLLGLLAAFALSLALCPALAFAQDASPSAPSSADVTEAKGLAAGQPLTLTTQANVKFPSVKAAKYYVSPTWNPDSRAWFAKVSGVLFKLSQDSSSSSTYLYNYTLSASYGGTTKTIDTNIRDMTTNGRYVYYSKAVKPVVVKWSQNSYSYNTYRAAIYRLDLKTGAKKKVAAGNDWSVFSANKNYVYCGAHGGSAAPGNLYAVNLKTGAKKKIYSMPVHRVICSNTRVMFTSIRTQIACSKLYTCTAAGKSKRLAASHVGDIRIYGGKVLYVQANSKLTKLRLMKCSFTGSGKKTVKGWTSDYNAFKAKYSLGA